MRSLLVFILALAPVLSLEAAAQDAADAAPARRSPPDHVVLMVPFKEVRLTTVPPPAGTARLLHEDGETVTLQPEDGGEPVTRTKADRYLHGEVKAIEDGRLILSVRGRGEVAVRQADILKLESRHPGSPGRAVVGGLAGIAAGFLATALGCLTIDNLCNNSGPLWAGMAAGAVIGGAAGGAPEWRPASLLPERRVAFLLQPTRGGAAAAIRIEF